MSCTLFSLRFSQSSHISETKRNSSIPSTKFCLCIDLPLRKEYIYLTKIILKLHYEIPSAEYSCSNAFSSIQTTHSWKQGTLSTLEYRSKDEAGFKYPICIRICKNILNVATGHCRLHLFCTVLNKISYLSSHSKTALLFLLLIYFTWSPWNSTVILLMSVGHNKTS